MMTPTVHLNGTGRKRLVEDACNVMRAIADAIDVARAAAPHGRDYYTQAGGAFEQARREYTARIERLEGVRREYEEFALAIDRGVAS